MGANSAISWTHHTFNPWIGCCEVSPACDNCYARMLATCRMGLKVWGKDALRRETSQSYWHQPFRWDRAAAAAGERHRVFCGSLCDVMEDRRDLDRIRGDLWKLIESTPNLDWLLLTKRPQNFRRFLPPAWLESPAPNVWGMATVESPEYLWRADELRNTPFVVRGLSMEPLLAPIEQPNLDGIHWVIVGGESGGGARPMYPAWPFHLMKHCRSVIPAVAFHFKQWGCWYPAADYYADDEARERALDEPHILLTMGGGEWTPPDAQRINDGQPPPGTWIMRRMGKEKAGRVLSGRIWDAVPEVRNA